ncbi:MAG: translation initiation factor IF-3 [Sulfurimonas sp. RIFOXYD12_FULL_33_39]|uniref:translation initiation factor IF-3 n=1 Tax=unclassified Sulfurimonas TaxID=2623549 RepID=UPI0008CA7CBD|nr:MULTISPECIES: translation initiation factor IF-3 [unclassified Sulfurimonas]OHE05375.1 MAG: translation initiation factor IF-3 [Sulfurimonas sp. RIFCSPLOWO2_12_FULL_34_6]OHE09849.1 MAG: translation initiation factor IF-3 [Sulfurimonas sp. RIFOXYD12_FULL_33_39]OHE13643.1 MAG: translation initiation factor IF-3 [Sulfurimonas sp. RIFOXYD2_FULL_34_21]DAB27371.1 MAG TPA: translation initiation factor IF-3 [Sulfurimonas sp. UBA10385]
MSKKDRVIMNDDIRVPEVRCNVDGAESLGIISIDEAMEKANELGLDLVLIAPDAKPPVAKIMDYGKYKYQEEKKLKEQRKNQVKIDVKEIKLSVKIAENDIAYKVKHAREFIEQGKHVRFRVFLKGREMANPEAAKDVLLKIWPMLEDIAVMDKEPKFEGRYYNMYILPQK